jgi:hypothetical protein
MNLWQEIRKLEGKTLKTLDRKRPFDIITIDDTQIIVQPHVRNLPRPIKREAIEGAWRDLIRQKEISMTEIKSRYSDWSPVYVTAVLAELPNVEYQIRPIRLFYKEG